MASAYFKPLDPPVFIVCDDVRSEIGGKFVLVGVYPGNVIVVRNFPTRVAFATWLVFKAGRAGPFDCQYRFKMADGTSAGLGRTTFTDPTVGKLTTFKTASQIEMPDPATVHMQLRFEGEEQWSDVGRFEVRRA